MKGFKFALAAAALLIAGAAALPAQAFTYDSRTNQNGGAKFRDPDSATQNGENSHFSMKFRGGPSGQQQSGYDSRFVPSANSAFGPGGGTNGMDTALGNRHW